VPWRNYQSGGKSPYLVGDRISVADIAAAALLSPALIPSIVRNIPGCLNALSKSINFVKLPPGL